MNTTKKPVQFDPSGVDLSNLRIAPSPPQMPTAPPTALPIDDGTAHLQDGLASITDKLKSLHASSGGGLGSQLAAQMLTRHAMEGLVLIYTKALLDGLSQTPSQNPLSNEKPSMSGEVPK